MGMVVSKHMNEQKARGSSVHDNPSNSILSILIHGYEAKLAERESKIWIHIESYETFGNWDYSQSPCAGLQGQLHTYWHATKL